MERRDSSREETPTYYPVGGYPLGPETFMLCLLSSPSLSLSVVGSGGSVVSSLCVSCRETKEKRGPAVLSGPLERDKAKEGKRGDRSIYI